MDGVTIVKSAPDVDFWRRAHAAGFQFAFVPRLTAIKFPASGRRNVYRERPSHEQAARLARIESDPDLEAVELGKMLAAGGLEHIPYRDLIQRFINEVFVRLRRRFSPRSQWNTLTWRRKGAGMDAIRRFKGLS